MGILYALVGRGSVVLAEFSATSGNAGVIARRILEKIAAAAETRVSYSQDRYIFHILKADGFTFLCMADDGFGNCREEWVFTEGKEESFLHTHYVVYTMGRVPFSYLQDIHMRFMKNYGQTAYTALPYALNDEFSRVLHQQMEYFSSNPNADTLNRVRGEINEVRTVMVENIDKVLARGEKIDLLVDKTSTIQDNAFRFRKQSRRLQQALWMKNAKLLASLTCLIVVLLYLIISMFCGGLLLKSCRSS